MMHFPFPFRFLLRSICPLILPGLALGLATGCQSTREDIMDQVQEREYFQPRNFQGEARLPLTLHRVLLLPLCGGTLVPPESAAAMEEVFATELQKQSRFEVVRISRAECRRRFGAEEFPSVASLPHDFLTTLGRVHAADAVLFIDLTTYRGYRPLALGVRAKLATVKDPRLLWMIDEIFSADDPAVSNSVRHFYSGADLAGIPLDPRHSALQSPAKFAAYVAAATFNTLPPR